MNHCVPNWDMDGDPKSFANLISSTNQFGSDLADNELVELLWRNGHVVMQSQTHRKPIVAPIETKQPSKCINGSSGSSNHQIESVDTSSWLNYTLDDPLEKDFCSDFFYEMPISDPISSSIKSTKSRIPEETNTLNNSVFKQPTTPHFKDNPMPPPVVKACDGIPNFSHFSRTNKVDLGSSNRENFIRGEAGESSVMTVGSSHCDSNQVQCGLMPSHLMSDSGGTKNTFSGTAKEDASEMQSQSERSHTEMLEPTVTSSSGGSRGSFGGLGKLTTSNGCQKRKIRDGDESEWHSEEAEYESVEASKQPQRSQSARRSRAAEVHNLSERRRRDRINEKMKALQELIPHCNKSDKASMLDEAIEYLKSLQMQVQILWMGSGMAPMMLPSIQHYMPRMGLGINPAQLPSMNSPSLQMPRIPLVNQSMPSTSMPNQPLMSSATALNPVNFQNPMQNAQYMGFHHMPLGHQLMNLYPYGSQMVQQIQTGALASANVVTSEALDGTTNNVQSGSAGEAKLG